MELKDERRVAKSIYILRPERMLVTELSAVEWFGTAVLRTTHRMIRPYEYERDFSGHVTVNAWGVWASYDLDNPREGYWETPAVMLSGTQVGAWNQLVSWTNMILETQA